MNIEFKIAWAVFIVGLIVYTIWKKKDRAKKYKERIEEWKRNN